MKRKFLVLMLLPVLVLAMFLTGCAGMVNNNPGGGGGWHGDSDAPWGGGNPGTDTGLVTGRRIVYTYHSTIFTACLDTSITVIQNAIAADPAGQSFVQNMNQSSNRWNREANFTLRISTEYLSTFIAAISGTGTVNWESLTSQDMTQQYINLEARENALLSERERWEALLEDATTFSDISNISNRITQINQELNTIRSQLLNIESLVALSTAHINLIETTDGDVLGFWARTWRNMQGSGRAVTVVLEVLLVIFIYVIPYAFIVAVITVPTVLLTVRARKKKKKQSGS